ncbi:DMT family transporter [Liquorilactobacillus mali]|uniref:Permease n=1 Tax=Liquorilactobacillus mali KCTC 3596 = DSM 20444 TaxID=1046596 RepID=J0UT67_9LACO|nr:DMT family transporter [Liquorilactobacillus mali]EJF00532.1 permease [Liquorilactobacillus mali KCTC 3596 = DSM 20444]KRN09715.1 permease [Liquorilactobacillus mali KCTC 3596 = DSM 20444]MDV7758353.1 EamA family transporter [Liquorilactobacillus mali]QFQ74005.1 EamA family transporter [Liquorilactobacillus mali]
MDRRYGIILAISGASFWGTSGVAVQYLYQHTAITSTWLVAMRLIGAGLLLATWAHHLHCGEIKTLLLEKSAWSELLPFSIIGVGGSQFTYFMAVQYSNASTATVIQFLSPLFIILYTLLVKRILPKRIEIISVFVAIIGTIILVTGGHLEHLSLSTQALIWGLLAAFCTAMEVVLPNQLMQRYQTIPLTGVSMLLCGLCLLPVFVLVPWPHLTIFEWGLIVYIIIVGTLFAYLFFLASIRYIPASTTGMLGAFEPLVATILTIALLGTHLSTFSVIGGTLIILATIIQSLPLEKIIKAHKKAR